MLIVGSYALKGEHYSRKPNDIDVICYKADFPKIIKELQKRRHSIREIVFTASGAYVKADRDSERLIIECSFLDIKYALQESNKEIYAHCLKTNNRWATAIGICFIAPVSIVYLMKYSHRFKKDSSHFLKTRIDIRDLERDVPELSEAWYDLDWRAMLQRREQATYTNGLPKLNTSKKQFFTDSVPYKYDHDTIHEAVKMLDKPAYQYYIKDGEQVLCDMVKFKAQPEIVKLYGVLEESYVLALERAIIPFGTDPDRAFNIALEKVCTSITSGVFREYAWQNYFKVQELYHESFVTKFNTALAAGKILAFTGGMYEAKPSSD